MVVAKKGFNVADAFTFTQHDDKTFWRKKHNAGNARNEARNECIKKAMKGRKFGDKDAVRSAFSAAAKQCAGVGRNAR